MIGADIGHGIGHVLDVATDAIASASAIGDASGQGRSFAVVTGAAAGLGAAPAVGLLVPFLLRPDDDTATDGWTDQAGGSSNIYQSIDEAVASDSDYVRSPEVFSFTADLKVRLFDGATQIAEWTHSDIGETFVDAEQTLTAPEFAAISNFSNLFAEFDDDQGNVYRFPISDPPGGAAQPVKVKYRYKKLVA